MTLSNVSKPRAFRLSLRTLTYLVLACVVLTAALPALAQDPTKQQERFMDVMSKYLDFSARYVRIAEHPHAVLHLSVESIVETYENRGEGIKAVEHLRGLLVDTDQRTARNIVRMKIRDLLVKYGRDDEALAELDALFNENKDAKVAVGRPNARN